MSMWAAAERESEVLDVGVFELRVVSVECARET